jgi:riboflavin synthase
VGTVRRFEQVGDCFLLEVEAPDGLARYVAPKGSITINGVSLTVNQVQGDRFQVNLIPHTLEMTTLKLIQPGSRVNLEVDLLARYAERLLNYVK